jgi:hypothetical protein
VEDVFRSRLIEALKSRSWTYHAAERAASFVASLYQEGGSEWKVWPSEAREPDLYRVAGSANADSVYDSRVEGRARDVADALNEIERHGSDATGIP